MDFSRVVLELRVFVNERLMDKVHRSRLTDVREMASVRDLEDQ